MDREVIDRLKAISSTLDVLSDKQNKATLAAANADMSAKQAAVDARSAVTLATSIHHRVEELDTRVGSLEKRVGTSLPPSDGHRTLVGRVSVAEADVDAQKGMLMASDARLARIEKHLMNQSKAMALPTDVGWEGEGGAELSALQRVARYLTSPEGRKTIVGIATLAAAAWAAFRSATGH